MRDIVITFTIVCLVIGSIMLVDRMTDRLNAELTEAKERVVNDSILVSQYQAAMYELMHTDPDCAGKFQKLLEKNETYKQ